MNKKVLYGKEAREKLLSGINKIADAVAVTLGPSGRNVLIGQSYVQDYGTHSFPNEVTKDGYRVTKRFDVDDFAEKRGVLAVKECAEQSVMQSGDGTTTTVVLMRHIVQEGIKAIDAGANPMELKKEIDIAVARVVSVLKTRAIQIGHGYDKILQIATISANNDEKIGKLIADAFAQIGHEGSIDIEAGKNVITEIKVAAGYRFDKSWAHPLFINNKERQTVEFDNPLILLYSNLITHHKQIVRAIELVGNKRPVLIICPGAQEEGLATLVLNSQPKIQNNQLIPPRFNCCLVIAPGIGDAQRIEMEDIAILTGATFMADNRGFDITKLEMKHFGMAKKVVVTRDETTIIIDDEVDHTLVNSLLDQLRLNKALAKNEDEAAPIEKRIAKLTGGVAVIQVGAATETEQKEKMDRFDDSVRAVKSAIAEGYTVGSGTALMRIRSGSKIVDSAMDMILRQICYNVGLTPKRWWQVWKPKPIFEQVRDATGNIGYNAKTGRIEDLIEAGVIDPVKVLRCALLNAASSGTMILTTEAVIVDTF